MNCGINIILIQTKWIFALMSEILQVEPLFIPKLMTHILEDGGGRVSDMYLLIMKYIHDSTSQGLGLLETS